MILLSAWKIGERDEENEGSGERKGAKLSVHVTEKSPAQRADAGGGEGGGRDGGVARLFELSKDGIVLLLGYAHPGVKNLHNDEKRAFGGNGDAEKLASDGFLVGDNLVGDHPLGDRSVGGSFVAELEEGRHSWEEPCPGV